MQVLRTPDERFQGLPDFPYEPAYLEIDGGDGTPLRIAYVDEGDGPLVLLMHGEPTWSYLYRKIIAALSPDFRVVVPDLIGFGRSDKPAAQADFSYERHVGWMRAWLEALDLTDITLFCQDWGGLIGLRLVAAMPDRFAGVIASNTGLPIGSGWSEGFERWRAFSQSVPELPVGRIVDGGAVRALSAAEIAAYDAPFPDESYKAGARIFPTLVPVTPDHASVAENKAAWEALGRFDKPFVVAFSDADPITRGADKPFRKLIPGAAGLDRPVLPGGHFVQEDCPEQIAALIAQLASPPDLRVPPPAK